MIDTSIIYFKWSHTAIHNVLSRKVEEDYTEDFMNCILKTFVYLGVGFFLVLKKEINLVKDASPFYRKKAIQVLEEVLEFLKYEDENED